ncbi:MAG TPA: AAA domain-containing protein [Clostridia bacterium]|nr:AAA domain-containing protein [Clostridia bacterium]
MFAENDILSILKDQPGLKGRELAARMQADKSEVNSLLWKLQNRGLTRQDNAYRWFIVEKTAGCSGPQAAKQLTILGRLCRYYLECLSLDDEAGVRVFARSQYALDYVELPELPGIITEQPVTAFAGVDDLFRRLRNDRERKVPYIGYPVRLRKYRSANGWEGFFLEPVFLFGFNDEALRAGQVPAPSEETPAINPAVIKSLAIGNDAFIMEEAAKLAEELGLGEPDVPDFDEVVERLTQIREEWDWKETLNPRQLSTGEPLSKLDAEGIYNRCIIFGCERSPYTKGLEQELAKLQDFSENHYKSTALGMWLERKTEPNQPPPPELHALLEPLPLNSEQREAIDHALTRPLTVITGPPGTGKSQVVSSLLINAAKLGKRVLFASKNNKAVDVVEARVNNLGPRPILLRLGRGEYQSKLTEYLTALLASRATDEDRYNHDEAEKDFSQTLAKIKDLHNAAQQTMKLRNDLDVLERKVEPLRGELGEMLFRTFRTLDIGASQNFLDSLKTFVNAATRRQQDFFTRLFWFAHRAKRFEQLNGAIGSVQLVLQGLGLTMPPPPSVDADIVAWCALVSKVEGRIRAARQVADYFSKLIALSAAPKLEATWHNIAQQRDKLAKDSLRLWEYWLRLAPSRLSARERELLGEFAAVLRLLVQSDEANQRAGKHVFAQYYKIFPALVNMLSCWAVTSLSTRGRVPLEPGFFDLVVIDEASQCDIASALPLLFRAKAAVIIGDPKQLRHISAIPPRRDRELLHKHNLADGYAKWAYSENSLFDLASPLSGQDDIIMLRDHHRSHADIIEFSNQHFYEGRLRIATKYDRLRRPAPDAPAVRWVPVQGNVVRPGTGALNEIEAKAVVKELERLCIQQGYSGTVGVVTPFRAQANRIRDLVNAHPHAALLLNKLELLIDTVHKFQGDERDVMIFSPVVSKGIADGAIGFLKKTDNLFNVAITRARAALIVVGDPVAAKNAGVSYLSGFANYVEGLGKNPLQQPASPGGACSGPDYPQVAKPELVSDWERLFYCHLWEAGLRPIPQYAEEKFLLDFALFGDGRKLNIEVDGERYHRDWNGELLRRDQLRNMRLIELGWDVMRFWVYELRDEMPGCIARVKSWCEKVSIKAWK